MHTVQLLYCVSVKSKRERKERDGKGGGERERERLQRMYPLSLSLSLSLPSLPLSVSQPLSQNHGQKLYNVIITTLNGSVLLLALIISDLERGTTASVIDSKSRVQEKERESEGKKERKGTE